MPFDVDIADYDAHFSAHHSETPSPHRSNSFYRDYAKRVLDVALILISLPIVLPLIALGALLVARDGHNPFYTQLRVGKNGRHFRIFKLRTMVPDADAILDDYLAANPAARLEWNRDQKLKNDPRIVPAGHLLRKTSLDELPQLFNVLIGDMSLIGPRPMMVDQQSMYDGQAYYDLRPGLSGLWQISDRNNCEFRDRVKFDEVYNEIVSFSIDLGVIFRTFRVMFRGTGY